MCVCVYIYAPVDQLEGPFLTICCVCYHDYRVVDRFTYLPIYRWLMLGWLQCLRRWHRDFVEHGQRRSIEAIYPWTEKSRQWLGGPYGWNCGQVCLGFFLGNDVMLGKDVEKILNSNTPNTIGCVQHYSCVPWFCVDEHKRYTRYTPCSYLIVPVRRLWWKLLNFGKTANLAATGQLSERARVNVLIDWQPQKIQTSFFLKWKNSFKTSTAISFPLPLITTLFDFSKGVTGWMKKLGSHFFAAAYGEKDIRLWRDRKIYCTLKVCPSRIMTSLGYFCSTILINTYGRMPSLMWF